jgi:MFS family permease
MTTDTQGARLGYIDLQPGVSRMNGLTLLYAGLTGIPLLAFLNFIQPIILEVILEVPREIQAPVTANLAVLQEIMLLVLVGPFGALSDRLGRRKIVAIGYLFVAAGFFLYPFASSVMMLALIRCIYAVGAAALVSTYSAVIADYPQEKSRGKLIALLGVCNGLGIMLLGFIGGSLPKWLEAAGMDATGATRSAMAIIGTLAVISALVIWTGLKGPGRAGTGEQRQPLVQLLRQGLGAARNPRIAVAYGSAFAARGDVVVIGTYVSLWISQTGIGQGMTATEAQGKAGMIFGVIQAMALVSAPLFGILNDRINRVSALIIGMFFAAAGYLAFGLQDDPLGSIAIPAALLLGVGQIASILAGQTLISQEADPRITGAVIGVFSFFGAIGTLAGSWIGGQLFALWRPGAPFLLMGMFNLLVMIAAIIVRLNDPGDSPAKKTDAGKSVTSA